MWQESWGGNNVMLLFAKCWNLSFLSVSGCFTGYRDTTVRASHTTQLPQPAFSSDGQHWAVFFQNKYFIPTVLNKVFVLRATELKVIIITYFNQIFCLKRFCCFQSWSDSRVSVVVFLCVRNANSKRL